MNVKDLAKLIDEKKYAEFCNALEQISPRVTSYIWKYIADESRNINKEIHDNVSEAQFKKYRSIIRGETEMEYLEKVETEYIRKGLKDFCILYELTDEEKKQACLI